MNNDWRQDPRVQAMDPKKIEFLAAMTAQINRAPKNQLLNQFLMLNMEASKQGIIFSDQETALLTEILVNYMNPADRGKLDLLRMMSKKLASKSGS